MFHALAEPVLRQLIDLGFVQFVLVSDLEDEVLLLWRTIPTIIIWAWAGLALISIAVSISAAVANPIRHDFTGQKAGLLDFTVNTGLHEVVEFQALG